MISSLILAAALTGGCPNGQCVIVRPVHAVARVATLPARVVVHRWQVTRSRGWLHRRR